MISRNQAKYSHYILMSLCNVFVWEYLKYVQNPKHLAMPTIKDYLNIFLIFYSSGRWSPTSTESTQLAHTMVTPTSSWRGSTSTIMRHQVCKNLSWIHILPKFTWFIRKRSRLYYCIIVYLNDMFNICSLILDSALRSINMCRCFAMIDGYK